MAQDDDEFAEGRRALSPVVISAIGATFLVFIFSRTFQLAFIAIMSRLLSPAEFGIAAAATLFISFVQFSALFGVGVALVQAKSVDRNMLRAANTFSVGSALFFTLLSIAAAPLAGL
ncbi:MAG: hypothetical protein JWM33_1844, partial [Caulobacteraceae bacterium]|nr:hypothetical protein [Caulobacteraceae bacterium]